MPGSADDNELSLAQTERLAILCGELGDAQRAIGKIMRYGYLRRDPAKMNAPLNKEILERELGHVVYAMEMLDDHGEARKEMIEVYREEKSRTIHRWTHHQKP